MPLLLLFVVLPAVELTLLIEIGRRIGTIETLTLILVTGFVGASLARHQGLQVLRQVDRETAAGRLPAGAVVDGVIILVAAALLITPGVLTDIVGFLCLLPFTRSLLKKAIVRWLEERVRSGQAGVRVHFGARPGGPVYDVTPDDEQVEVDGEDRIRRDPP